jgi:hypothetical protein
MSKKNIHEKIELPESKPDETFNAILFNNFMRSSNENLKMVNENLIASRTETSLLRTEVASLSDVITNFSIDRKEMYEKIDLRISTFEKNHCDNEDMILIKDMVKKIRKKKAGLQEVGTFLKDTAKINIGKAFQYLLILLMPILTIVGQKILEHFSKNNP